MYYVLIKDFFLRNINLKNDLYNIVMKHNLKSSQKYYNDKYSIQLLSRILELFYNKCDKKKLRPILLVIPQMHDLLSTELNHIVFLKINKKNSNVIDMIIFKVKKYKIYTLRIHMEGTYLSMVIH